MMTFVVVLHSIICVILVAIILIQAGRGGGLTEGFSAAESMFGAKTNIFLVRTTTTLAVLFFLTSASLAYLSAKKQESLMSRPGSLPAVEDLPARQLFDDLGKQSPEVQTNNVQKTDEPAAEPAAADGAPADDQQNVNEPAANEAPRLRSSPSGQVPKEMSDEATANPSAPDIPK